MADRYEPPSEFLKAILDDQVPLTGSEFADTNLRRLIEMTRDEHPANRDWATFLLAADEDLDTPEIRNALLAAAEDESGIVRAEAILGLAERDKNLALPLLQRELAYESVWAPIFEAAKVVAAPSLADPLRNFAIPSGSANIDELALEALTACETGKSPQPET
jgi:hypothetical protein